MSKESLAYHLESLARIKDRLKGNDPVKVKDFLIVIDELIDLKESFAGIAEKRFGSVTKAQSADTCRSATEAQRGQDLEAANCKSNHDFEHIKGPLDRAFCRKCGKVINLDENHSRS